MLNWPYPAFLQDVEKKGFVETIETLMQQQEIGASCFSYHPRVLTEVECRSTKMFYREFRNTSDILLYKRFELKVIAVFEEVLEEMEHCYVFEPKGLTFIQKERFLSHVIVEALRKETSLLLFLPEQKTLVSTGYDLTWEVFSGVPMAENRMIQALKRHQINVW
jgi:hypothetical protein